MIRRLLMLVLVLSCASACAADEAARREVSSLRRQVDQLRHKSVRDQQTIRELEGRLFVIEDRQHMRRLPVETAHAEPPPVAVAPAPAPAPPAPVRSPDEVEIVYEGDALVSSGARPSIAVNESGRQDDWVRVDERPVKARRARTDLVKRGDYPDPAAVTDRIPVAAVPGVPPPSGPQPVPAYKDAYEALKRHDHGAAVAGFKKFLDTWPQHDYADNAQYWLGEAQYDKRDFKVALLEFRKVIQKYPAGNKAPDALLKVGFCYLNLGDAGSARDVLTQVVDLYPKTEAAKLAAKRLEELR
jgi:tol-pal system protein YbgF